MQQGSLADLPSCVPVEVGTWSLFNLLQGSGCTVQGNAMHGSAARRSSICLLYCASRGDFGKAYIAQHMSATLR